MTKPTFSTLENQIAQACAWMLDFESNDSIDGVSFELYDAIGNTGMESSAAQKIAARIVEELKTNGELYIIDHAQVAAATFLLACRPSAEVTRLDWLAAIIEERLVAESEGGAPGDPKARQECEALLRDLRAACALAGVITEPPCEPMTRAEECEETDRRR